MWSRAEQLHYSTSSGIGQSVKHIHYRRIVNDFENYIKGVTTAGHCGRLATARGSGRRLARRDGPESRLAASIGAETESAFRATPRRTERTERRLIGVT